MKKRETTFQEDYFFTRKKDVNILSRDGYFLRDSKSLLLNLKTSATIRPKKTDSDRYADMTYSCLDFGSETHIKPH